MAVYKHNGLLKASIASATNAHRLGANEAPPTIISVFLGSQMSAVLDKIEESSENNGITMDELKRMKLGVAHVPEVLVDNTDRNRTSPFAFTGNRFEFRAAGSSANCSSSMIVLNSIVAAQLASFTKEVSAKIANGLHKEQAIFEILRRYIKESKPIRFDGNGYSDEWKEIAKKRGLNCETSVPLIYDAYTEKESVEMFRSVGVLNSTELHARNEVKWEVYTKKIQIESRVLGDLSINHIIPVATRYQSSLLDNLYKMKIVFDEKQAADLSKEDASLIEQIASHISVIKRDVDAMVEARKVANKIEDTREKAIAYCNTVEPYFKVIRYHVDKLELIVDNEIWPLPKYRELLFIN